MKTKFILYAFLAALIAGCDLYKEDAPVVIDYSMNYLPNQPIMIDLAAYIDQGTSKSFVIKNAPTEGTAEILEESFIIYSPASGSNDQLVVDILNSSNTKIGEARINLEASLSACGIAKFDYAEVQPGTELVVNLTENDQLCNPIREAVLMYTPIENADGLSVTISPRSTPIDPNEETRIELRYIAPEGFKGKAKGLYVAAINIKEEYRHQWNTDEMMINPVEKFEFFVASLAEVNVK